MSTHASARQVELYVLGALEPEGSERLEQHVRGCPDCAAVLAAEARFEMSLQELLPLREDTLVPAREGIVVTLPARPAPPAPRRTYSAAFAAAIALVVGLWGVEATRLDVAPSAPPAFAEPAQAPVMLACELSAEEPVCPAPETARVAEPLATPRVGICAGPAGGSCSIQRRGP
jgi:hypothetical protein